MEGVAKVLLFMSPLSLLSATVKKTKHEPFKECSKTKETNRGLSKLGEVIFGSYYIKELILEASL